MAIIISEWGKIPMVIMFCESKSKIAKEIAEILTSYGADHITDSKVEQNTGRFILISKTKPCKLGLNNAAIIFCTKSDKFKNQMLPKGVIGICDEDDRTALKILSQSNIPVITCGMNQKNTVTLSSLNENIWHISLQRNIQGINAVKIIPSEFKIKLKKQYNPFSILAAVTALLINGIKPYEI